MSLDELQPRQINLSETNSVVLGSTFNIDEHCSLLTDCSRFIQDWMTLQPSVKEESLTDWLLFQLSAKSRFIKYRPFTRREENRNGADWEWWFLFPNGRAFAARIQAKRLSSIRSNFSSVAYQRKGVPQIDQLRAQSRIDGFPAFYAFYTSLAYPNSCKLQGLKGGVFLAEATMIYNKFVITPRRPLIASDILKISNPLSCLFCCPLVQNGDVGNGFVSHLKSYFSSAEGVDEANDLPNMNLRETPDYIENFFYSENPSGYLSAEDEFRFNNVRALMVIDMSIAAEDPMR
jgi:hypothetical protein